MSEPRIALRRATMDDAPRLLAWRNAPSARRWFFMNSTVVRRPEHLAWFKRKLQDPGCRIYIAESGGRPIGQLRLEKRRGVAEVSISIDRSSRGRGLGTRILKRAGTMARRELGAAQVIAFVRQDNVASAIAFLKAGYRFRANAQHAGQAAYVFALQTAAQRSR